MFWAQIALPGFCCHWGLTGVWSSRRWVLEAGTADWKTAVKVEHLFSLKAADIEAETEHIRVIDGNQAGRRAISLQCGTSAA